VTTPPKRETAIRFCPLRELKAGLESLRGRRVGLVGLGSFGGGEGAARFLSQRGAEVIVSDLRTAEELSGTIERLSDLPLRYALGGHSLDELTRCDLIVANPAVPRTSEVLRACSDAGAPLTTPMNMFLALCRGTMAGVTGSVGKSTATSMLAAMLRKGKRRVHLGGNIGISLLPEVDQIAEDDLVVLELSCFQLEDAADLRLSPHVAVLTNLTPNHLDRYESVLSYVAAKQSIVEHQHAGDLAVLNWADATCRKWACRGLKGDMLFFNPEDKPGPLVKGMNVRGERLVWSDGDATHVICHTDEVSLPGEHNVANALAASAAALWLGIPPEGVREALAECPPLEHRLEECAEFAGMHFFNDSDATTPDATIAGLRSFEPPLTLIAGGHNKGLDLTPVAEEIARRADVLVSLGDCGKLLSRLVREASLHAGREPVVRDAATLNEAVETAVKLSMPGSVVLFSPGCASFDMFPNFAERGRQFKLLVSALQSRWRAGRAS